MMRVTERQIRIQDRTIDRISGVVSAPNGAKFYSASNGEKLFLRLQKRERETLAYLVNITPRPGEKSPRTVTFEEIFRAIGIEDEKQDRQIINRVIYNIRQVLGEPWKWIESYRGVGFLLFAEEPDDPDEKAAAYEPLLGLKACFSELPDAGFADISVQFGSQAIQKLESRQYLQGLIAKGVHIRMMINSPEALEGRFGGIEYPDYVNQWSIFAKENQASMELRISSKPFYHRVYLVRDDRLGAANIREYFYAKQFDVTRAVSRTIRETDSEYRFLRNEFEALWEAADPIGKYHQRLVLAPESFVERVRDAIREKENGSFAKYISLMSNLADEGCADAANCLGIDLIKGACGEQDVKRGLALVKQAADQRYPIALFNMGLFYELGCAGLEQDARKAVQFFHAAADRMDTEADACFHLYVAYRDGFGTDKDVEQMNYYRLIASKYGITELKTYEMENYRTAGIDGNEQDR